MRLKQERFGYIGITVWVLVAAASMPAAADGDDRDGRGHALHGDYGFTMNQTCVRTPFQRPPAAGFDPATRQLLVNGEIINAVGLGVVHFAKNGMVTIDDAALTEILLNQISAGQVPVAPRTGFSCGGSYALQPNNKVTVTLACEAQVSQPGVSVTLAPFEFEGFLGHRGRPTSLSSISGNIQTVTVAVGGNAVQQRERICTHSLVLDKL